jgi:ParB family chromosome partitioning protein
VRRILGNGSAAGKKTSARETNADIRRLETELTDKLGARVTIDHTKKGAGKILISYNSLDELDGILKHVR